MKNILLSILTLTTIGVSAQCTFLNTATLSGDTLHNSHVLSHHSSVAYNPNFDMYYSCSPGGGNPHEFFDGNGVFIDSENSVDFRGFWYNPNTQLIEGNCWDKKFYEDSLNSSGGLNNDTNFINSTTVPHMQSVGAFNYQDTLIHYYYNGSIYTQHRVTFDSLPPLMITGITDFSTISAHTIIYTGCINNELGIYDLSSKELHLINANTGAITTTISLASIAPNLSTTLGFGVSFANDLFWVFNVAENKWIGFNIYQPLGINETTQNLELTTYPNPTTGKVIFSTTKQISSIEIYNLTGQKVTTFNNTNTIDISNLTKGVYFAKIITGTSKPVMQKLIKE
ncbi:MAG: T9SS type A sorting domain-containing protein [Flavobacteriales bacterium]|nr:T9SS type A sorting domain-containing protein [Flavobacteriales bacterium]NQX97179.1 T9SS type A sorting domain-containing protein [Flavobacteriales bacterium]